MPETFSTISSPNGHMALTCLAAERYSAVMAFSLRRGGWSPPPFDSLNFSVSQGDSRENVHRNFAALGASLGIDPRQIVTCRQVHSDHVIVVESSPETLPEGDAILTPARGLFPAVKTADCLPILLLDPVRGVAGAVHAGWRGTVLRITRKVVNLMHRHFGSQPSDLVATLGPAIGSCCYEVDDAVLNPFRQSIPQADRFISRHASRNPGRGQTFHLDLTAANRWELIASGVPEANLHAAELCTCCHQEFLYSHRRDGSKSGRHIALVGFKG